MSNILRKTMHVRRPAGCDWVTREYYDPTGVNVIGWTGRTLNPWRGCTHVKGRLECDFCWSAQDTYARQRNQGRKTLYGLELVRNDPDTDMGRLEPRKVFTGLLVPQTVTNWIEPVMSEKRGLWFYGDCIDLFHEDMLSEREDVVLYWLRIMQAARWQTFQVLTKRATLMKHFMERLYVRADGWIDKVPKGQVVPWDDRPMLPNVWFGVTLGMAEKKQAMIGELKQVKCIVRYLSMEPLFGHIGISDELEDGLIHWVICGGEAGSHMTLPQFAHREMKPEWARSLRNDCWVARVPFFFKQWSGPAMKLDLLPPLDEINWPWLPRTPLTAFVDCDEARLIKDRAFLLEEYQRLVVPWGESVWPTDADREAAHEARVTSEAKKRKAGTRPLLVLQ